jgi:hypothetical protein
MLILQTKLWYFGNEAVVCRVSWNYNGQIIEIVNDFNYLGVVFNYTGSCNLNQEYLVGKALKALNVLLNKCKDFDLKPHIFCQLFDSFVGAIISYGA